MLVAGELLKSGADVAVKNQHYTDVITGIKAMLQGAAMSQSITNGSQLAEQQHSTCVFAGADQLNWVAAAATVSSVLHHAFEYFHWTVRAAADGQHVYHA